MRGGMRGGWWDEGEAQDETEGDGRARGKERLGGRMRGAEGGRCRREGDEQRGDDGGENQMMWETGGGGEGGVCERRRWKGGSSCDVLWMYLRSSLLAWQY